jgi:hypothetical protein
MTRKPTVVTCPVCNETRLVKRGKLKVQRCKPCYSESMRVSENHKIQKSREKSYRLRSVNPEKFRARARARYQELRDELIADQRDRRRANPEKHRARNAVARALKAGKLERQPCVCGSTQVEAHHDNYSKPLDVRWLCPACHGLEHRKRW